MILMSVSACATRSGLSDANAFCVAYPDPDRPAVEVRLRENNIRLDDLAEPVRTIMAQTIDQAIALEALREEVCF